MWRRAASHAERWRRRWRKKGGRRGGGAGDSRGRARQDEDAGLAEEPPGEGDELALPEGEVGPCLLHLRVQSAGHRSDGRRKADLRQGVPARRLGGPLGAVEVPPQRALEEHGLLRDDPEGAPSLAERLRGPEAGRRRVSQRKTGGRGGREREPEWGLRSRCEGPTRRRKVG